MKKIVAYLLITFLSLSVTAPIAQAVVKPGAKCSKLGDKQDYESMIYTCKKSKGKLVWDKGVAKSRSYTNPFTDDAAVEAKADKAAADSVAANKAANEKLIADKLARVCTSDSNCPLGSKGPGGGRVFYDAGSKKSWGRYLEAAPDGWVRNWVDGNEYADVETYWCEDWRKGGKDKYLTSKVTDPALKATLGVEIGKGKANTDLMVSFCTDQAGDGLDGAGHEARQHQFGGMSDWFLPSKNELIEFCKFIRKEYTNLKKDPTGRKWGGVGDQNYYTPWIRSVYKTDCPLEKNPKSGKAYAYLWSSSEKNANEAWAYSLASISAVDMNQPWDKSGSYRVMPVRAFSF